MANGHKGAPMGNHNAGGHGGIGHHPGTGANHTSVLGQKMGQKMGIGSKAHYALAASGLGIAAYSGALGGTSAKTTELTRGGQSGY